MLVLRVSILCVLLQSPTWSQSLPASTVKSLDAFLKSSIDEQSVPGVVALVAGPKSVIYHKAFGFQNERESIPLQPNSLFRIASMTKPVTSVAVMQLVESGSVSLDDPIGNYLPEYASLQNLTDSGTEPIRSAVTIRQLLAHTSGYGYWFSNERLSDINRDTGKDIDELPLVHEPGARWTYGCSTRILGFLIEKVSKDSLDNYFDTHIFQPLGMNNTGFKLETRDLQRLVTVHRHTPNGVVEDAIKSNEDGEIVGDYGLRSTASDYAKFLQMFLNDGELNGSRILSAKSVHQMTTNQIGDLVVRKQPAPRKWISREFPLGAGIDKFGLGFQLSSAHRDGQRSPGSYSWAGIYNTHFWVDPDRAVAVVLMMQVLPFYDEGCIKLLQGFEERLNRGLDR